MTLRLIPSLALAFMVCAIPSLAVADSSYQPYYYVDANQQGTTVSSPAYIPPAPVSASRPIIIPTPTADETLRSPALLAGPVPSSTSASHFTLPSISGTDVSPSVADVTPQPGIHALENGATDATSGVFHSLADLPTYVAPPEDTQTGTFVPGVPYNEDHHHVVAKPQSQATPQWPLGTRPGVDLAWQASDYNYREPGLDSLSGWKTGADAQVTGKFYKSYFATADLRYNLGMSNYSGSGTSPDHLETLLDVRGLLGRDFIFSSYSLSPYVGLAYRTLYSDGRGVSSTDAEGYRRDNDLYYVPIGISPRFVINSNSRISTNFEYDYVFRGLQTTYLSDVPGYADYHNGQHQGYGLRTEIMWETPRWSFGPFANLWVMSQSASQFACGSSVCGSAFEPHNNTLEVGGQIRYHAFDF